MWCLNSKVWGRSWCLCSRRKISRQTRTLSTLCSPRPTPPSPSVTRCLILALLATTSTTTSVVAVLVAVLLETGTAVNSRRAPATTEVLCSEKRARVRGRWRSLKRGREGTESAPSAWALYSSLPPPPPPPPLPTTPTSGTTTTTTGVLSTRRRRRRRRKSVHENGLRGEGAKAAAAARKKRLPTASACFCRARMCSMSRASLPSSASTSTCT
mmetsp:Transcript_20969/g.42968  ORF Transcript_20969/g.42968 Transcript_20969/m.42968 type:complete len:213 (+) Transcript_20969:91-729(+)